MVFCEQAVDRPSVSAAVARREVLARVRLLSRVEGNRETLRAQLAIIRVRRRQRLNSRRPVMIGCAEDQVLDLDEKSVERQGGSTVKAPLGRRCRPYWKARVRPSSRIARLRSVHHGKE
jgi:hypothetical protein